MKDFFRDLSENILERDFIIRVLVPLAATMVFAFVFYLTSPFVLLLGLLAFAILFLITNYQKKNLEDSLFYDEENTNPLKEIREEVSRQIEAPVQEEPEEVYEEYEKPSLKDRLFSKLRREDEYVEYEEYEEPQPAYEEPVRQEPAYEEPAYQEPVYQEPVRTAPKPEPAPERPRSQRRENEGLRKKVGIPGLRKKEVPVKQDLDYDDDFEFEFGSYDE